MDDNDEGGFFCDCGEMGFHYNNPFPFLRYSGEGEARHLTALKLGKRPYYEDTGHSDPTQEMKREKMATAEPRVSFSPSSSSPPRCQVEGCNFPLAEAKEYHRRHKVCDIHSKASRVVVHGLDQRFCQQCSRFHVISEFDDSKRSCRRRLAGHNERRRKNSGESLVRNGMIREDGVSLSTLTNTPSVNADWVAAGCRALPLLSSASSPSSDLSYQSSAALLELIAENRAAVLSSHLLSSGAVFPLNQPPLLLAEDGWEHLRGPTDGNVTLDLMETAMRPKSADEDEECCEIWKSLEGTHVA